MAGIVPIPAHMNVRFRTLPPSMPVPPRRYSPRLDRTPSGVRTGARLPIFPGLRALGLPPGIRRTASTRRGSHSLRLRREHPASSSMPSDRFLARLWNPGQPRSLQDRRLASQSDCFKTYETVYGTSDVTHSAPYELDESEPHVTSNPLLVLTITIQQLPLAFHECAESCVHRSYD